MAKTPKTGNKKRHRNSNPYCKKCNKSFIRWAVYKEHKRIQHSKRKEKMVCPLWPDCKSPRNKDGLYANKSNLKTHFSKHHKKVNFNELDPKTFMKVFLRKKPYSSDESDSDYDDDDLIPLKDLADRSENDSSDKFNNETITSSETSDSDSSVQRLRQKLRQISSSSDENGYIPANSNVNTDNEFVDGTPDIEIGIKTKTLGWKPAMSCGANENQKSSHIDDESSSSDDELKRSSINVSRANNSDFQTLKPQSKKDSDEFTDDETDSTVSQESLVEKFLNAQKKKIYKKRGIQTMDRKEATAIDESDNSNECANTANTDSEFAEHTYNIEIGIKTETIESDAAMNSDESVSADTIEGANIDNEFAEDTSGIEIGIKTETLGLQPVMSCDANENKKSFHIDDGTSSNDDELQRSSINVLNANDSDFQTFLNFSSLGQKTTSKKDSDEYSDGSSESNEMFEQMFREAKRNFETRSSKLSKKKTTATDMSHNSNEDANIDSEFAEGTSDIEIGIKTESIESDAAMNSDENVPVYANNDSGFAEGRSDIEICIKTETLESKPMSHVDDDTTSNDDEQHSSENLSGANDTDFRAILDFTSLGIRPAIKNDSNKFHDDRTVSTEPKESLVGKFLDAQKREIYKTREIQKMDVKKATATVPVLVDYPITFSSDDDDEQNEIGVSPSQHTVARSTLLNDTGDVKKTDGESYSTIFVDTHSDEKRQR